MRTRPTHATLEHADLVWTRTYGVAMPDLPVKPPVTTEHASEIERRRATVMFVDILGATELSAQAGIEQAYAIVTGCLRVLDGIARRHGGVVDKYLSDCLMVVFGVPIASAEAPIAAVAAAAEMIEAAARYGPEAGSPLPLTLRIGINTGLMVAGELRGPVVREFAVMGDAVNVAARLKDLGAPGGVHVGPETHAAARAQFQFEAGEPLPLRGKTERVPVFRLLSQQPNRRRAAGGRADLVDTPLIGRTRELTRLRDALAEVCAGRRSRILVVRGDEGAGKSRLLAELCATATESGTTVLTGRAALAHRDATLFLAADVLADWADVGIADDSDSTRAKLAGAAADIPAIDAAGLAETLGSAPSPTRDATLAGALASVVETLAARRPLVVACEDVQWADDASLALIVRLANAAVERPVLWILTARPEAPLGNFDDILDLPPLAPEDAGRLVDHVTGGAALSAVARTRIERRAGGNPARLILGGLLAGAVETEVAQEAATVERASETERRRVTVLFADITGFTRMSEQLPPAESYRAVSGCLAVLHEVAAKHGGSVDKYLGDCIMAVFGAPVAIEDAPRAAVNAAIEMRRRVREYNQTASLPTPLDIHVGINTGLGVAGDISGPLLREFTLMGESVSHASKLKDVAPAGRIWVGAETHKATRGQFAYEPADKGAWELQSEREQLHRGRGDDADQTLFSTMVGRDEELRVLGDRFARLASGDGGIATITAEAGLGKSRLIHESLRLSEAAPLRVLEARSISMGGSFPYYPFVDLMRGWAGVDEDDSEHGARAKLDGLLQALLAERTAELAPFIARLMGLGLDADDARRLADIDAEGMEKLIARSLREVLIAGAALQPLVLFFEDVHWADLSSVELLLGLLPLAREHAIVFLLAARPDYEQTSTRLLAMCRDRLGPLHCEVALARLNERDCGLLLRNLIRHDTRSHTTRALVLSRADGNPFFIEEVIRTLIELGAIERTDDGLRVTARIEEVQVPGTIQEVVMARVDRLRPELRDVLQLGSVLGRTFPARLLEEVSRRADLELALAGLVRRDLLERNATGGEAGFAFKHALAQETVYESILQSTRRRLHAEVAAAVERLFADRLADYYGMLAYHFGRAEDLQKASDYLLKAGNVAERVAASSEALAYFREAARLYDVLHGERADPEVKALLDKRIGAAYLSKGDLPSALEHFDRALAHLGASDPTTTPQTVRRLAADLSAVLFHVYVRGGRPRITPPDARTRELIEIIFQKGKAQSTSAPEGYVLSMLRGIRSLGRVDPTDVNEACGIYAASSALFAYSGTSFDLSARFLPMAKALVRNVRDELGYRTMAFLHHYLAGHWGDEHVIEDALLDEGLRYGAFWEINTYLGLDCERRICQGRFDEARALIARLARIGDEYGYGFVRSNEYFMTAALYLQERNFPAARTALDLYYADRSEEALNLLALGTRCEIEALCGDVDAARRSSDSAQAIALRVGRQVAPYHVAPHVLSRWLLVLEACERESRDRRELSRRGQAALRMSAKIARERPKALRLMARQSWMLGRRRAALRWWERAFTEATRLNARPELARVCAEASERLRGSESRVLALDADALAARGADIERELAALGRHTTATRDLARSA